MTSSSAGKALLAIVVFTLWNLHLHSSALKKVRQDCPQFDKGKAANNALSDDEGKATNYTLSDESILKLWQAKQFSGERPDLSTLNIHIVLSHCVNDLDWMTTITNSYNISSIHIISKCGKPILNAPTGSSKEILPNAGRNDHSYLYYITTILDSKLNESKSKEEDSIVLFLKDSNGIHNQNLVRNSYDEMIKMAASDGGFSCGTLIKTISAYHKTSLLKQVQMSSHEGNRYAKNDAIKFKSGFLNLNSMLESVGTELSSPLTQVCYGGDFAASVSNIRKVNETVWNKLEQILTRGDNIEEGHMMERSWGALLSKPLTSFQTNSLFNYLDNFREDGNFMGALTKKKIEKKH